MYFKTKQISIQQGVIKYDEDGKLSAMKEIKNLVIKNDYFSKLNCNSIIDEMK